MWPKLVEDACLIIEAADVLISGPGGSDKEMLPPIVSAEEGIIFNGVADDGHETFSLTRRNRGFVKTLQKPYDLTVACVLLRAYLLAPSNVEL